MGRIVNDIVDEIDVKPNKWKLIVKWVVGISGSLIITAFAFGQFKSSFFNRLDDLETKMDTHTERIEQLETSVNGRIDKAYDDGVLILTDFQQNINQQLGLIIDYGSSNKDMLKRMLEINEMNIEGEMQKAKNENPVIKPTNPPMQEPVIGVRRQSDVVFTPIFDDPFVGHFQMIELETNDTINYITGATEEYIKSLKRKYDVGAMTENPDYPGRYDVAYRNK